MPGRHELQWCMTSYLKPLEAEIMEIQGHQQPKDDSNKDLGETASRLCGESQSLWKFVPSKHLDVCLYPHLCI